MSAPMDNKFWLKRSKHGVAAVMSDPVKLKESADEYFEYTSQRNLLRKDWVGKDAQMVQREYAPPFTIHGFAIFFGMGETWWRQFKNSETVKNNQDFQPVIAYIESTIYNQKFEGAAAGLFNGNIIARDLGLRDGMNVATPPGESIEVSLKIAETAIKPTD